MLSVSRASFRFGDPEVYGEPPDESISHAAKIYGLSVILAAIALTQWLIIGSTQLLSHNRSEERYGWWLLCTFFAVATLSWTKFGRKVPFNYIIIGAIVESSTIYIAMEQRHNENRLVNFYAGIVVVALMLVSIFWGAYFPMFIVPGDLLLSCLVVIANIMMIIFFINVLFIDYQGIYYAVRNVFALVAICMVMYTATIIHDRQFDVPKNEYLFLSVLQFFSYMILHERILALSFKSMKNSSC